MAEEPEKTIVEETPQKEENLGTPIPGEEVPQRIKDEAYRLGWRDKTEFRGEEGEWVDAVTYLIRGVELQKHASQNAKYLNRQVEELRTVIDNLRTYNETVYRSEIKKRDEQIRELLSKRNEAIKEGDVDTVTKIEKRIDDIKETTPPPPAAQAATVEPLLRDWYIKNEWYNTDEEMKRFADGVGEELAKKNAPLPKILEKIEKEVKDMWPERFPNKSAPVSATKPPPPSPVESGSKRVGATGAGKKHTWNDLTEEQKTTFKQFERHGAGVTLEKYIEGIEEIGGFA